MKKRLLSLTLIAALCLSLLPVTALAAGEDAPDTLLVDGIDVTNGGYWTTNNGSLTQTQSTTEWNVHYDTSTNILNLNNATIKNDASDQNSNGAAIYAAGDAGQDVTLTIKVEGSNVISGAHGIYMLGESSSEENPSLSLSIEKAANATNASLEITGTDNGITLSNDGSKSLSISNVDVTASGGENGAGVYMSGSGGDSCSLSVSGCTLTTSGGTGIACVDAQDNSTLSTTVTLQNHAIVDARQGGLKGSIESFEIAPEFGGLLYDQQTIQVLGAFTLAENMTIGEDVTLYVGDKGYPGALTIPEDGTLTNNGTVTILGDSRLINKGTITNNGTVTVSGGSALTNNGTLCNYGTLTGEIDGNGTVIPTYTFNYPKTLTLTASGSGFYTASDTLSLSEESDLGQAKVVVYGTNKAELNTLTLSKEDDPSQTMPSGDVAITATFAEDPNWTNPEDPSTDVSEIFTDVPANHWAKAAIQYVYDNGLMTGVSDSEFAPEATTTRAMIVSMLARMENVTSAADAGFSDVTADDWYATAVNWAAANGIVSGISDDTFAANDPITREQLAAMLMKYAQYKGLDTTARADLSHYSDAESISSWANDVLSWAVAEGLLNGVTDDQLQPQGNATRAQVAAILERFLENVCA